MIGRGGKTQVRCRTGAFTDHVSVGYITSFKAAATGDDKIHASPPAVLDDNPEAARW